MARGGIRRILRRLLCKKVKVDIALLRDDVVLPTKRPGDAGYDLYCSFDEYEVRIPSLATACVPLGIAIAVPKGYFFEVRERGSTGQLGMKISAGIMDEIFRGEWFAEIYNGSGKEIIISKETRQVVETAHSVKYPYLKAIAQGILREEVDSVMNRVSPSVIENKKTARGNGSLGSSGK